MEYPFNLSHVIAYHSCTKLCVNNLKKDCFNENAKAEIIYHIITKRMQLMKQINSKCCRCVRFAWCKTNIKTKMKAAPSMFMDEIEFIDDNDAEMEE